VHKWVSGLKPSCSANYFHEDCTSLFSFTVCVLLQNIFREACCWIMFTLTTTSNLLICGDCYRLRSFWGDATVPADCAILCNDDDDDEKTKPNFLANDITANVEFCHFGELEIHMITFIRHKYLNPRHGLWYTDLARLYTSVCTICYKLQLIL